MAFFICFPGVCLSKAFLLLGQRSDGTFDVKNRVLEQESTFS
jgi:hypothetical protein